MPIYRNTHPENASNGEGTLIGICRVALPMEAINTAIGNLRRTALIASVAGLVLAIVFSVLSTGAIINRLRN